MKNSKYKDIGKSYMILPIGSEVLLVEGVLHIWECSSAIFENALVNNCRIIIQHEREFFFHIHTPKNRLLTVKIPFTVKGFTS